MTDPSLEDIVRVTEAARYRMKFISLDETDERADADRVLLHLATQLEEKEMWLSRLGTSEVYEEHAEEVAHLAAQLEDWKGQACAWQRNAAENEARYQRAEAALATAQGRLAVLERQHAKGPQSEEFP